MGLWHIAGAVFLFRWIFRDPKVDLRFVAVGALLPLLVDGSVALVVPRVASGTKLFSHSLITAVGLMALIMVVTKRGPGRKPWMALSVGVFFHLLLDGMWAEQESFLWPLFGKEYSPVEPGTHSFFVSFLDGWVAAGKELVGAIYLWALWVLGGLADSEKRTRFLNTGILEASDGNR